MYVDLDEDELKILQKAADESVAEYREKPTGYLALDIFHYSYRYDLKVPREFVVQNQHLRAILHSQYNRRVKLKLEADQRKSKKVIQKLEQKMKNSKKRLAEIDFSIFKMRNTHESWEAVDKFIRERRRNSFYAYLDYQQRGRVPNDHRKYIALGPNGKVKKCFSKEEILWSLYNELPENEWPRTKFKTEDGFIKAYYRYFQILRAELKELEEDH